MISLIEYPVRSASLCKASSSSASLAKLRISFGLRSFWSAFSDGISEVVDVSIETITIRHNAILDK